MRHLFLCIALLSATATSAAAAPIDDAKKAFGEGKAAFERGDYEAALAAYQNANRILPAPNLYYNIGATYEKLGRYQEAALAFDAYFRAAGTPGTDDEKDFQEKLRVRAEADRKRPDVAPARPTQPAPQAQPVPRAQQPAQPPPGYYAPGPYYMPPYAGYAQPLPMPREDRLRAVKARHTRAIVLMAIGVPLAVAGITVCALLPGIDTTTSAGAIDWGVDLWAGVTLAVVGTTLWAPGAASFVKSSREMRELQKPDPLPPAFSGQH